jgi:dethiobiotin synthetase
MRKRVSGLFITGTDTGVGKTYVGALLARQLRAAGYSVGTYKPVASGCRQENGQIVADDALALWQAAGSPGDLQRVCPQRFLAPLAPHLAARAEGRTLDANLLRRGLDYWSERSDVVIVEGAGGLLSPLGEEEYVADLARDFGFPLLVVARNSLGAINQTLQTLVAAATFRQGLSVAGVILNAVEQRPDDVSLSSNLEEISRRAFAPVLGCVAHGDERLAAGVDWFALAAPRAARFAETGENLET